MKIFFRSFLFVIAVLLLAACSSWKIENANTKQETFGNENAVIEQMKGRDGPKIKTYRHLNLNIYKRDLGDDHNDWWAPTRIETPPGKIRLQFVTYNRIYLPEVEFKAMPGHKYLYTSVCIPYPFIAVIEEKSSKIVAIDSYCPDCKWIIGKKLTGNTECIRRTPVWLKIKTNKFGGLLPEGEDWNDYRYAQAYRNLCYAADHNVISAFDELSLHYRTGEGYGIDDNLISKDPVLHCMWLLKRKNSKSQQFTDSMNYCKKILSVKEQEQLHDLLKSWKTGDCEKSIFKSDIMRKRKKHLKDYKLMIGEQKILKDTL